VAAAKRSEKTGQQVTFTVADVATLPTMAKAGGGLSKQAHTIINNVSRVFGKKLVVFDSDDAGAADGFVIDDDPDTIYLNRKSEVPHLVVFGHELLHSLRRDNKDAYESIVKSIKMAEGVDISETPGIRGDIEEFTADLLGNRFRETEFWVGTFRDIIASKGQAEGKKVVTRLAATATRAINGLMKALGRAPGFNTDKMVANLGDVKTALRGALSNYANQRYDAAVALERERLSGPARGETVPVAESGGEVVTSARRGEKPGQLDGLVGYHFSNQARQTLSTGFYGTGLRGSDRDEIQSYPDKRVGKRLSFYFDKGTGVRPESGVGGVAHRVALDNIYDSDSDPLKLKRGANKRAFEAAVLDAGFDGYMTRLEGTQPGQVVVLGDRTYKPEVLGPRSRINDSEPAVAQAAQEPQWKNVATGPTREGLQDRMARMESSGSWSGYDMQIVEAGRGFYALQTRPKVVPSEKRGESGRPEQAGDRAGRYSIGSLAPLEGAPNVAGASGPDPRLVAVAEEYARETGIPLRRQGSYVQVDEDRARRIAAAYDAMPHAPLDPAVREAYDNLARQTLAQYRALERAGYQFYLVDETNDPYGGNPWNAMRDLRANQRMGVFATEAGFGTSDFDPEGNPLLADTGLEWSYGSPDGPKKRVLFNDLFRAVHDAFGHGLEGAGFRAQGEENAWQAHVRLFTGSAVGAITSETRGQNSWLNYGPYGEQNRNARVEDTVFADQKTGLMPEWTWTEGRAEDEIRESAKRGPQKIEVGKTILQSEPLTPEQWASVREIGLKRMTPEERAEVEAAERRVSVNTETADKKSVEYVSIAKAALDSMPVPQLSTVPILSGRAPLRVIPTGKVGKDGKRKTRVFDVARALRNRFLKRAGDINTEQGQEAIARAMAHEALYALSQDGHAVGWYDRKVVEAIANAAIAHPRILTDRESNFMFRVVLAVTSNGQAVRDNFSFGNSILKTWFETNRLPEQFDGGGARSPAMKLAFAKVNRLVQEHGWEKTEQILRQLRQVGQIEKEFDLKISGENKKTLVPVAVGMGGPKIGNFFANLSGFFDNPTMDLWFMRTVGRMAGSNLATKPSLVKFLDDLSKLLPETGEVNGIDVKDIREEIAAYKALEPDEQTDPELTIQYLQKTEQYARKQYQIFSTGTGKVYENGKTRTFDDKSPLNLNARSLVNNLSTLVEAPGSGNERNNLRKIVNRALALLRQRGIQLNAADLQAVLWYYEKNLYGKVGNISESAKPWDYASAARWGVGRELGLVDVKPSGRARPVREGESGQPDLERPGSVREGGAVNAPQSEQPLSPGPFTRARSLTQRQAGDAGPADVVASEPPAEPRVVLSEKRTPLGFYSALAAGVGQIKTNAAPAQGWKDAIKGLVNKGQVKQDEVEWSGVNDWLDLQQGKVTREEVAEYLKQGGVQVEETVLGGAGGWSVVDQATGGDQFVEAFATEQEAEARAQELGAREYAAIPSGNTPTAETKYAKYTLPGGTNYREVLLTLPFRGPNFGDWAAARGIQLQALSASEADRLGDEFDAQAERGMYRSKHWDPPNVLAHIRVNDRTDADGKRVLFVEELQSDWGQEGKKKGFIGGKVKGYQVQFNGRPVMTYETRQEADAHVERAKGFDKEAPVSVVEVETTRHSVNERAEGKVLNAPFVTKTEGWLNLALKRVMIMAAEGGYDRVAFTTGAQNAERFSLDKTLREIAYEPTEDGKYEITATDLEGTEVISEDEVRLDRIEELVGKEIAEKIARDEGERDDDGYREWRYLRGDNLKVEAKGMRAFYDTIVPTALKKLLPKVGGGQMAAVNIIDAAREPEMVGVDEDGDAIYDDGIGDSLQQPGFDVTPAMREKVSEGLPLFSEKRNIPDLNAAQEQALRNVGGVVVEQTVGERAAEFKNAFARNWIGGIFDQFNELRSLGPKAYMLARMSKGSEGTLEATMLYGKPFLTADGVADVKLGGEGFAKVLGKLEGEHDRFLWWVAAQRADQLKAQGLENLFTDKDISALKSLNQGNTARGTARGRLYAEALRDMNDFNDAILKIAEQSGLVDPEARALFKNNPYVPFYRVMEGDGVSGPTFSSGLTNQYAWKKLKGGSQKLNNDLLANVLMNWSHLLSASAKNRALTESLKAGVAAGVAQKVPSGTKESVRVRVNGKEEHYLVSDPGVMSAISAIEYRTPGFFRPFSTMKRWLSVGVTANPAYKVKNLIRDSVAAPAVSDLSGNVIGNVAQGIRQGAEDSQTFASMLAGGGVIRFGSMLDGGNADRTRTLVRKEGGVLLDEAGWKKVSNWMGDLWDAYNTVGDKFENANRVALYEQLKAKGYSDLEANFLARDLMDFSMSGRWPLIRFLVETVPFLNARLQGLFKLGRGAKENPRKFGAVVGAVALASIALLAAYEDDEDWKRREDWDRDTNWWFKIGDMSFRIPKPFEVGAIGTIAERGWEMAFNKEMDMKRFGQSLSRMIFSTFAMDPTPQIVKPILDVYMNKGAFTNRPIESMTMARQRPEDRYDENTSYAARFLGQMGIPSPLGLARAEYTKLSPVQIDYLIRGYFAWLGTAATTVLDFGIRPMMDAGDRPDRTLKDTFFVGNFVETLPAGGSRYVTQLYEQSREIEQAYASYRDALKENDRARARELSEDYAEEFRARPRVNKATKEIAEIRRQINMIESSKSITGETKRVRIDNLRQKMARIAERATAP
jgi:hypothetical protein